MTIHHYVAIADKAPDEPRWSITFPDFPGITSVADGPADLMRQAGDALATAVEDMVHDGEELPESVESGSVAEYGEGAGWNPLTLLVPVDVPDPVEPASVAVAPGA